MNYIQGDKYREAKEIPPPTFFEKMIDYMKHNYIKIISILSLVVLVISGITILYKYISSEEMKSQNKESAREAQSVEFLQKHGYDNIKKAYIWEPDQFNQFKIGSGCFARNYEFNFTATKKNKYVESAICCSDLNPKERECRFNKFYER